MFYVKDMSTKLKKEKNEKSDNEPKYYIVLSGKRNILGKDKSDMSNDYEKDDEILPFQRTMAQASGSMVMAQS